MSSARSNINIPLQSVVPLNAANLDEVSSQVSNSDEVSSRVNSTTGNPPPVNSNTRRALTTIPTVSTQSCLAPLSLPLSSLLPLSSQPPLSSIPPLPIPALPQVNYVKATPNPEAIAEENLKNMMKSIQHHTGQTLELVVEFPRDQNPYYFYMGPAANRMSIRRMTCSYDLPRWYTHEHYMNNPRFFGTRSSERVLKAFGICRSYHESMIESGYTCHIEPDMFPYYVSKANNNSGLCRMTTTWQIDDNPLDISLDALLLDAPPLDALHMNAPPLDADFDTDFDADFDTDFADFGDFADVDADSGYVEFAIVVHHAEDDVEEDAEEDTEEDAEYQRERKIESYRRAERKRQKRSRHLRQRNNN